ncbi:hypothetical protein RIU05_10805, partial [Riemerella anatipestifer]
SKNNILIFSLINNSCFFHFIMHNGLFIKNYYFCRNNVNNIIFNLMKKIFVIALVLGLTSIACSKKENTNAESNIMLPEPEVAVAVDTTKTTVSTPAAGTTTPATDSTATK